MHTEVRVLCCPDCGTTLGETVLHSGFQSGGTSIGPPTISCPNCGLLIDTGKSEWREKSTLQKTWFISSRLTWFSVSAFFLGSLCGIVVVWGLDENGFIRNVDRQFYFFVVFGIASLLLGALFCANAIREIRESDRRVAKRIAEEII